MTSTADIDCTDARQSLPAYIDLEVASGEARAIEAHLAECPACRSERDAQAGLRADIRRNGVYHKPPADLRERIIATLPASRTAEPPRRRWTGFGAPWNLGAALASVIAVVWTASTLLMVPSTDARLADELVASHVRSLIGDRAIDVASSDQHTVKPWFNGKLDYAPPVTDLSSAGFALLGGRVDYIGHRRVAALAYQHRQHVINVYVWPGTSDSGQASKRVTDDGYNLLGWSDRGMHYWAVSDVEVAQLEALRVALGAR